ncbi:hypothetical protein DFH01_17445 [Falsiroseomonas bella]|uniref:Uncharacterized protein n=1 Tax=Falsiroseomonas bella TaxID=2184016 RepID=A0A317FBN4_9PROT|nr:hypothetical protein [Falsiroseomonas bella]PWS35407.1 hypothetical protein DFH01_17445 [Falsiroseomonas bella]
MSSTLPSTTQYIWFGTRAVDFVTGGLPGEQVELLSSADDFATRTLSTGTFDFTGSEWQQFLAFTGTQDQIDALGINLDDGVDTATAGFVNTTGDLRVGDGVEAYNIADSSGGGRLIDVSNTLDDTDDPIAITGLGKANAGWLDSASIDSADAGNRVVFSNNIGFGFINGSGFDSGGSANALRLNDGDAINFEIRQGKELLQASFTVKVLNGGSTQVVIDSDGATIRDTNANLQGGFVQDDSLGELNLGMIADGAKVTIDYVGETILINDVAFTGDLGAIVAFFDAFQAGGSKNLTLGSVVGNQVGWSADDLVLATDTQPDTIPPLPTANGMISFRYTSNATTADLDATLDIGKNGSIDAFETLATSFGGGGALVGDADGDTNKAELNGTNVPFDILRLVTIGQQDANAPEGHQTGTLDRSLGIGIDTGAAGASLDDGSSLGGNYGDEGAGGTNHLQNGEFIRFDLGADFEGVSARIVFSANSLVTRAGEDAVVRLLDSTGALVDQFAIDLDGGLTHVVSGSAVFDQVEIEALANTQFAIADVDIDVFITDLVGIAEAIGEHLRVQTVLDAEDATPENNDETQPQGGTGSPSGVTQSTPTENGTDRFAAFIDANENGYWDLGETKENLVSFGNGYAATEVDVTGSGLVDLTVAGGSVSGNQFFLGVGSNGWVNGSESVTITTLSGDAALAGVLTIRGPVSSNPQNNPLADIAAGTEFLVRLFNDADNDGVVDGGELVEELSFTVGTAQQAFTADLVDAEGASFDAVQIAAVSGAFTVDSLSLFMV